MMDNILRLGLSNTQNPKCLDISHNGPPERYNMLWKLRINNFALWVVQNTQITSQFNQNADVKQMSRRVVEIRLIIVLHFLSTTLKLTLARLYRLSLMPLIMTSATD